MVHKTLIWGRELLWLPHVLQNLDVCEGAFVYVCVRKAVY